MRSNSSCCFEFCLRIGRVMMPLVDLLHAELHPGSPRPCGDGVEGFWHVLGAGEGMAADAKG